MRLRENESIGGRFRLERLLGQGGMGVVWAAQDLRDDRRVALKFLRVNNLTEEIARRFYREARAAMAVHHPNVVRIHEVFVGPDGNPIMSMDCLEGESLAARLDREGKLSLADFCDVFLTVVSAIGSAHARGIIHRDLKPENIFLCKSRAGVDVRVLDFGIAKLTATEGEAARTAGLTATGAMLGTPYYMSPEQVFAEKNIDHRSDIWSLGVILYECLSGRRPVTGDSMGAILQVIMTGIPEPLRTLVPSLPPDILDLSDAMLSIRREDRPASLGEVCAVVSRHSLTRTLPFGAFGSAPLSLEDTLPLEPTRLDLASSATDAPVGASLSLSPGRSLAVGGALLVAVLGGSTAFYMGQRDKGGEALPPQGRPSVSALAAEPPGSGAPALPSTPPSTPLPLVEPSSPPRPSSSVARPGVAPRKKPAPSASLEPPPVPSGPSSPRGIASENPYGK